MNFQDLLPCRGKNKSFFFFRWFFKRFGQRCGFWGETVLGFGVPSLSSERLGEKQPEAFLPVPLHGVTGVGASFWTNGTPST